MASSIVNWIGMGKAQALNTKQRGLLTLENRGRVVLMSVTYARSQYEIQDVHPLENN